jgi:hypothetical protein
LATGDLTSLTPGSAGSPGTCPTGRGSAMPPDSPDKRLGLPRSHVVEVIERTQEEAIRTLTQAGVSERRILATVRRIEAACRTALHEL